MYGGIRSQGLLATEWATPQFKLFSGLGATNAILG